MRSSSVMVLPLMMLLGASHAIADESAATYGVFGNIGLVSTSSDLLGYRGEINSPDGVFKNDLDLSKHTKLGAQIEYRLREGLDVFVQGLYRADTKTTFDNSVNLAFVRFKLSPNLLIRVGRTPFDLFLLTEYRDVDFAYPWAKLPQEVYGLLPPRNMDGIDLIYREALSIGEMRTKLSYGNAEYPITEDMSIKMNQFFSASAEIGDLHWSAAIRYTNTKLDDLRELVTPIANTVGLLSGVWTQADMMVEEFSLNDIRGEYLSLGARYEWNQFTVYAEVARIFGEKSKLFREVNNGYISLTYRSDMFEHFIGFAFAEADTFIANIADNLTVPISTLPPETIGFIALLENQLDTGLNAFSPNQRTFSIGSRWNYSENIAFKIQLDSTNVDPLGDTFWSKPDPSTLLEQSESVRSLFFNISFAY